MKTSVRWLLSIAIPFLLLASSISIVANTITLYRYGFSTYNISSVTGIDDTELDRAAAGLISYFHSGEEYIDITVKKDGKDFTLFNERETQHLKDVKDLFVLGYHIAAGALAICLACIAVLLILWRDRREIGKALLQGGILTLSIMAILAIVMVVDFDNFFYRFHLLSFANDLWLLDPTKDYLLMMFPQGFWFDAALTCAIVTAIGAVIFGVGGWLLKRSSTSKDSETES
jgi:integral membrane protein (TIGR01906 family)